MQVTTLLLPLLLHEKQNIYNMASILFSTTWQTKRRGFKYSKSLERLSAQLLEMHKRKMNK